MGITNVPGWWNNYNWQLKKRVKWKHVTGGAANAALTCTGIKTKDTVLVAYNSTDATEVMTPTATAAASLASIGDGKLDTVVQVTKTSDGTANPGGMGNEWRISVIDGAPTGTPVITVDAGKERVTIQIKSGTTTVGNVETAITALSGANDVIGVKTNGTSATVLAAATIGTMSFSGGKDAVAEMPKITAADTIKFPLSVTSSKTIIVGWYVG